VSDPLAPERRPAGPQAPGRTRHHHSPRARRLARDLGVDLAHAQGSGPWGRLTEADLRGQAAQGGGSRSADSPEHPRQPAADARTTIGSQVVHVVHEVDVTANAGDEPEFRALEAALLEATDRSLRDVLGATEMPDLRLRIAQTAVVDPGPVGDLTREALIRTLAGPAPQPGSRGRPASPGLERRAVEVSVSSDAGALTRTPVLADPNTAVLQVGARRRQPVVTELDGGEVIVVRTMALLSFTCLAGWLDDESIDRLMDSVRRHLTGRR